MALCLMGRVYAEQLGDDEMAKSYYERALTQDIHAVKIYPKYINVLLWNEDYEEASTLIDFALTVKETDKAVMYLKRAILLEQKRDYKSALAALKEVKNYAYNSSFTAN